MVWDKLLANTISIYDIIKALEVIIMDKYYEQLTAAYKYKFYGILKYLYIVMGVFAALTIFSILPVGLLFAALAIAFYFAKRKGYREYEYAFTSGDIDIDLIIEASKRKKLMNFSMGDVVMMAPEGSSYLDGVPKGDKIIAYPKDSNEDVYVAVVSKDSVVKHLYFTPDEEFINLCFRSNPQNVKRKERRNLNPYIK